jgi:putative phosphoesterase
VTQPASGRDWQHPKGPGDGALLHMRVAVISDTHMPRGTRRLPDGCVERLRAADLVLHAGDLAAASFLEELQAVGPPVLAVHGNVDEPALRAALPETRVVEAGGARIALLHDAGPRAGREERLIRRFSGCDAVVYGHTHLPQVECVGDVWVLNPGSPTERRRSPVPTMLDLWIDRHTLVPELIALRP